MTEPDESLEQAQRLFDELVRDQRATALWFIRDDLDVSIAHPQAESILESIARVADRHTWLMVRKLRTWRLRHCS
jgi:hypothetical protein